MAQPVKERPSLLAAFPNLTELRPFSVQEDPKTNQTVSKQLKKTAEQSITLIELNRFQMTRVTGESSFDEMKEGMTKSNELGTQRLSNELEESKKAMRRAQSQLGVSNGVIYDGYGNRSRGGSGADEIGPVATSQDKQEEGTSSPMDQVGRRRSNSISGDSPKAERPVKEVANQYVADANGNIQNPLFIRRPLEPATFKAKELPYLSKICSYFVFNPERAAIELSECIARYPEQQQYSSIIEVLNEIYKECQDNEKKKTKYCDRFNDMLSLALINPKNADFLHEYFKHASGHSLKDFAAYAVAFLAEKKSRLADFNTICSIYTEKDLRGQTIQTMFREGSISSFICKEYGCYLWGKRMKRLDALIIKHLNQYKPYFLSLEYNAVSDVLSKEEGFNQLESKEKESYIHQELRGHATLFCKFSQPILEELYSTELSQKSTEAFAELLQMRRGHIIRFLEQIQKNALVDSSQSKKGDDNSVEKQEGPSEVTINTGMTITNPVEDSKKYIGELLFLRILNPHLTDKTLKKEKGTERHEALVKLSKIIQNIAVESEFRSGEEIFKEINQLINGMRSEHDAFLAKYTLPKEYRNPER